MSQQQEMEPQNPQSLEYGHYQSQTSPNTYAAPYTYNAKIRPVQESNTADSRLILFSSAILWLFYLFVTCWVYFGQLEYVSSVSAIEEQIFKYVLWPIFLMLTALLITINRKLLRK